MSKETGSGTAPSKLSGCQVAYVECADFEYSLYGDGEALIGKWFKRTGKRDDIFLATKFGFVKNSPTYALDSSAEYCKKACAESLRLLGIPYIDLCKYFACHQNKPLFFKIY